MLGWSSSTWRSPTLPTQRSPTLALRELAVGRQPSWGQALASASTPRVPSTPSTARPSPKVRTSPPRTPYLGGEGAARRASHARKLSGGLQKALALPRRVRRPTGLLVLLVVLAVVALWLAAGQAANLVTATATAVVAAPALARHFLARSGGSQPRVGAASSHTYHPNGYLLVNPAGRHPILGLIERAERDWTAKEARQSKTLDEAVNEYRRRYRRNPPRGFDKWWAYVVKHKVQLPDEYDQIERDLRPYWSMDVGDLRHRNRVMQDRLHTFTLAIAGGAVTQHGEHAMLRRATDIADIIRRFAADVPHAVNMTFIIDDQPAVMMSYEQRHRMHELAALGEQFGPSEFFSDDSTSPLSNFARSCAPNSPLRKAEIGELVADFSAASGQRSFVWDHRKSMDLCQHPDWRELHGLATTRGTGLGPLVPLFTFAKLSTHDDILATPLEQYWDSYDGYDPEWNLKTDSRLLWRGTTTGAQFETDGKWRLSQRARLHLMSHESEGQREVLVSHGDAGAMRLANASAADLNLLYMDTAFAGLPAQCDPETCRWLAENIDFAPTQGLADSYQYKYMMDVDGNGWSGRFHRLMSTRSLVLKSTAFPEWYADRLQPWYQYVQRVPVSACRSYPLTLKLASYVPVKIDYSDLYDIMVFFVGSVDGHGGHDELAGKLAENGRLWAQTHWRRVDMAAYMFRLVLEYDRLLHQDDVDADYL